METYDFHNLFLLDSGLNLYSLLSCDKNNHHTYIYKLDLVESTLAYLDHLQNVK